MKNLILKFLATGAILAGHSAVAHDDAGMLEIVNLRVGQGDSTLIMGPPDSNGDRVTVLFDVGDISTSDFDGGNRHCQINDVILVELRLYECSKYHAASQRLPLSS